jgi:hypothetical protein
MRDGYRLAGMLAMPLVLPACTMVDPFIDFPQRSAIATNLSSAELLDQAIARLNAVRDKMQSNAREQLVIRSVSNTGILVGALTTLGFAAYGASDDGA